MELIKSFGIDPYLLGAQIVNFLIILYLLKRLLYKPVLEMLKNREQTIKEGIEKAEKAQRLMEKTLEEEKNILKKAQIQADKLIEEAKNQSMEMIKQSEESAKKQSDKILIEAKAQIERESKDVEKKLTAHVSSLAVKFLEKSLEEYFNKEDQEKIIKKTIKKFDK